MSLTDHGSIVKVQFFCKKSNLPADCTKLTLIVDAQPVFLIFVCVARFLANIEGRFWIIVFQNHPFPARKRSGYLSFCRWIPEHDMNFILRNRIWYVIVCSPDLYHRYYAYRTNYILKIKGLWESP